MYTGRITEIGVVVALDNEQIVIEAPTTAAASGDGDSFNVDGVCLSVLASPDRAPGQLVADLSAETRNRTALSDLIVGARVNLERPLGLGDRLHGHLVQGHVDAVGKITRIDTEGHSVRIWIRPPERILERLEPKGSVTVAGASLTVAEVVRDRFSVALIPTTLAETTLADRQVGDRVNLESDLLGAFARRGLDKRELSTILTGLPWAGPRTGARGVQQAAAHLASGGGVVVWDPDIEGEGDVVFAGQTITAASMQFLLTQACGHTTVPCAADLLERLQIPAMHGDGDRFGTAFHNSIDLAASSGTGISAHDRAATIRRLAEADAAPGDFLQPGHVFPLAGRAGGLAERRGHTEASLELCAIAGLAPVAAICEVMGSDGHMMSGEDLAVWSLRHGLPMVSVEDLANHAQLRAAAS